MSLNIALIADKQYKFPLETLLKSICCHHRNVNFYLLYSDIDKEWLEALEELLGLFDCKLVPVKIDPAYFAQYKTLNHISATTYYRLLIPQLIDVKRILYLDCDMIVDGNLEDLYFTEFDNKTLCAVPDLYIECVTHQYAFAPQFEHYFNAGVLLIDVPRWREENITLQTLELAEKYQDKLLYADQDVLNLVFHQKWKQLPKEYNVQVAARFALAKSGLSNIIEQVENLEGKSPVIFHYTTWRKPWTDDPEVRFKEKFWHYANLDWQQIWLQNRAKTNRTF